MSTNRNVSDRAVRPPVPPWWPKIEQDYFAVHTRRLARLAAESYAQAQLQAAEEGCELADDYPELSEDEVRQQPILQQGADLVRRILELIEAEDVPAVREAAVRYLLNRDFALPEAFIQPNEVAMLHAADTERNELRPSELQDHAACLAMGHTPPQR